MSSFSLRSRRVEVVGTRKNRRARLRLGSGFSFAPGGGAVGYFLGGYVPPGTPNWHPFLKRFPLNLISRSRNGPIFYTPF